MTGDSLAAALTAAGITEQDVVETFAYAKLNKTVVVLQKTIEEERLNQAASSAASQARINGLQTELATAEDALRAGVVPVSAAAASVIEAAG